MFYILRIFRLQIYTDLHPSRNSRRIYNGTSIRLVTSVRTFLSSTDNTITSCWQRYIRHFSGGEIQIDLYTIFPLNGNRVALESDVHTRATIQAELNTRRVRDLSKKSSERSTQVHYVYNKIKLLGESSSFFFIRHFLVTESLRNASPRLW